MMLRKFVKLTFWQEETQVAMIEIKQELVKLGIKLDEKTGQIFYREDFIPMKIDFELLFVRHGETYGNCGQSTRTGEIDWNKVKFGIKNKDQRIYQGNVDTEINQLTTYGKQQAQEVAEKLTQRFIQQ